MSFISPALISRIYQALGRNKGSHAILLLRQHSFETLPDRDNELMQLIVRVADECSTIGDLGRAEDHYKLGLALYDACFCDRSVEALRCLSGLMFIYEQQKRTVELMQTVDLLNEITDAISKSYRPLKVSVV